MKAIAHQGEDLHGARYCEMDLADVGARQVCIAIKAAALNHRDIWTCMRAEPEGPLVILGSDGAGIVERVGEEQTRRVDVRIVAATNRDLKQESEAKRFREDLYYRLNVFPIQIAPLRERKEDISVLAAHFVDLSARNLNRPVPRLTQGNILQLQRYDWPGNIRELQNVIERAVITSTAGRLRFDLPISESAKRAGPTDAPKTAEGAAESEIVTDDEMRRRERENILAAVKQTKWKISGEDGAAELLGIKPTTLASRMRKMGVERPV